jgi:hypothetical protein
MHTIKHEKTTASRASCRKYIAGEHLPRKEQMEYQLWTSERKLATNTNRIPVDRRMNIVSFNDKN